MNRQLKFQRQGDSLVQVDAPLMKHPSNHKKKWIIGAVTVGVGLALIFLIDGGIGIISAGIIELLKWTHRNQEALLTYLDTPLSQLLII